ncbi:helix-turn-helix domain-containing protein [Dysgonomonas sp. 521]|uniref:helix-turn-helix domain-containing protein n=1 Tax=Dysgonomonas sp. 521 TaxID=2302932 RepID=UPI0013D586CB|nr:helix-turn-helix domain-containing protein [Dysgonomonas sp. 521]
MSYINDKLINALKKNHAGKRTAVNTLMDILPMGREAAYRRLRGEIPFTLDEAAVICKKFNLSFDRLVYGDDKELYDYQLQALFLKDPLGEFCRMLTEIATGIEEISTDPHSFSYRAYRALPAEFFGRYDSISKVYLYILFYQLKPTEIPGKMADMRLPRKIYDIQAQAADALLNIDSTIILDKHIVEDFIGIVKYFSFMGLLEKKEVAQIKADLFRLIDDLEKCASAGESPFGKKTDIYISNISFDATYSYIEGAGIKSSSVTVFCVDYLSCRNPDVLESQRLWIRSLIRFSTQISVSGEFQRNQYFTQQRHLVDTML